MGVSVGIDIYVAALPKAFELYLGSIINMLTRSPPNHTPYRCGSVHTFYDDNFSGTRHALTSTLTHQHTHRHEYYFQVPKSETVFLNVDLVQLGVGGINSWGAEPLPPYRIPNKHYEFSYVLRGCATGGDVVAGGC